MGVLETTYNEAMAKPLQILGIFNDFFGEDKVDMQGFPTYSEVASALPESSSVSAVKRYITAHSSGYNNNGFILVHFPHVFIKNEHDRGTDINHLYAKVLFNVEGIMYGRFLLNRAEYSILHMMNGYMHSHISSIPTHNFTQFQSPCTGSGPINDTICSLSRSFDADLWNLFCLELSKYVEVESIAGTPYHRLEGLSRGGRTYSSRIAEFLWPREILDNGTFSDTFTRVDIVAFTKYLIDKNVLKFRYVNEEYRIAMRPTDCAIRVSNCFIEWYNKEYKAGRKTADLGRLLGANILMLCKYSEGNLIQERSSSNPDSYRMYIGQPMCTFKGRQITISIPDISQADTTVENAVYILRTDIIEYIITKIINVINFRYGNNRSEEDSSGKKVYFL